MLSIHLRLGLPPQTELNYTGFNSANHLLALALTKKGTDQAS
jgi:hypothetical protein